MEPLKADHDPSNDLNAVIHSLNEKYARGWSPTRPELVALPSELVLLIFENLELHALLTCRRVCHGWEQLCFRVKAKITLPLRKDSLGVLCAMFPWIRVLKLPSKIVRRQVDLLTSAGGSTSYRLSPISSPYWKTLYESKSNPTLDLTDVSDQWTLEELHADFLKGNLQRFLLQAVTRSLELDPANDELFYLRSGLYIETEEYQKALADVDRCVSICPDDSYYATRRGMILFRLGRTQEAIDEDTRAIALEPTAPAIYVCRATVYFLMGRYHEAIEDLNTSFDLRPVSPLANFNRGRAYFQLGQLDAAETDFENALKGNREDLAAHYWYGITMERQGKSEEGMRMYQEVLEKKLVPQDAEDWNALGLILQRLGKLAESIEAFDKAIRLYPNSAEFYAARARSLEGVGRIGEALEDRDRSLRLQKKLLTGTEM